VWLPVGGRSGAGDDSGLRPGARWVRRRGRSPVRQHHLDRQQLVAGQLVQRGMVGALLVRALLVQRRLVHRLLGLTGNTQQTPLAVGNHWPTGQAVACRARQPNGGLHPATRGHWPCQQHRLRLVATTARTLSSYRSGQPHPRAIRPLGTRGEDHPRAAKPHTRTLRAGHHDAPVERPAAPDSPFVVDRTLARRGSDGCRRQPRCIDKRQPQESDPDQTGTPPASPARGLNSGRGYRPGEQTHARTYT
jgi:hypothetical protein